MIEKCEPITHLFDAVHQLWDHRRTQRAFATLIFFIYLAGLLGIEANRQGVLPPWLEHITPMSHFQAIHLAFTLILGMEVMELILTISGSLSKSLGKQFEVMALILLRDAFKELSKLPEPVSLTSGIEPVVHIASAGLGALIIFICLGFYYQLRTHQNYNQSRRTDAVRHVEEAHLARAVPALRRHRRPGFDIVRADRQ